MATTTQAQALTQRLREWQRLLPIRVELPGLWVRGLLGLALRWAALASPWWLLRDGMTSAVVHSLGALGVRVEVVGRAQLVVEQQAISLSVLCTHIEVFALIGPLLWSRRGTVLGNIARLVGALATLLLVAVVRVDIAILLSLGGLPWALAHDVLLGSCYAAMVVLALRLGGWLRPLDLPAADDR